MNKSVYNFWVLILLVVIIFLILGRIVIFSSSNFKISPHFWDFGQDINLSSPEYSSAGFVIQDPRKVYISQDLKIEETVNYLDEAVLGVFLRAKDNSTVDGADYYLGEELLSGVLVSSDGWGFFNALGRENVLKAISQDKSSYVLVSRKNKKVYDIEDFSVIPDRGLGFLKVKNINNFPVRNLVNVSSLRNGQSLISYNISGQVAVNFLRAVDSSLGSNIKFSDSFENIISLAGPLSAEFKGDFIFNLNGDLLALIDNNLNVYPIHDFSPYIYSFLKNKKAEKFKFGVHYIDLRGVAGDGLPSYGAFVFNNGMTAVIKNSLAESAGVKTGDVIVKINNYEIDNYSNLNDVLNNFIVGDKLTVSVLRAGELLDLKIELK